jgi:hypothetical protein
MRARMTSDEARRLTGFLNASVRRYRASPFDLTRGDSWVILDDMEQAANPPPIADVAQYLDLFDGLRGARALAPELRDALERYRQA